MSKPSISEFSTPAAETAHAARLRRWVIVVGIVAIAANAGAAAYDSWRSYRQTTQDTSRDLGTWRDEAANVAVRTLVLSLLGALAVALLVRQLRRVELTERALRESQERYASALRAQVEKERVEADLGKSQKMEAMETLAGGIAHDFNNILGVILGYGEMAQKNAVEGSVVRRYVDNVMSAGARGKSLVERILAFSRSGQRERAPVNVQAIAEETLELLAASLPPGVHLAKKLEADDAAVIGDATQLHQVLMNLCTNALQAMPAGGVLEVHVEIVDVRERHVLSHGELSPRPYVRLTVRDTGTGIEPSVIDRMFDPFFTTKGVGQGAGLGLSLVHGMVADMDGAIDVVSAAGQGTTFAVWLPVAGSAARPAHEVARDVPRGSGEVIMVIDDEPAWVRLAEEMLAELGYDPAGFQSSTDALESFRAEPERFDAVLTDEMMPELSGTALAAEIRRLRPDIPIVLMSGYSDSGVVTRALAADVREVLRKPVASRDIAESLGRALRPRPSQRTSH